MKSRTLLSNVTRPARILLMQDEVGQAGGDELGVAELAHRIGRALVGHRAAGVEHDVAAEVGRDFVLLDVVAVGLGVDPPVDALDVVARHVLAVLGEIEREPNVRRRCMPCT